MVTGLLSPIILILVSIFLTQGVGKKSAANISHLFQQKVGTSKNTLAYIGNRLYSMEFYNKGKVLRYESLKDVLNDKHNKSNSSRYIALNNNQIKSLSSTEEQRLIGIASSPHYHLYKIKQGER